MQSIHKLLSTHGADKVAGNLIHPGQHQKRKCGVCKPRLPASKKGWAALHREARRRTVVYYQMKVIEEQLASLDLYQQMEGSVGISPGCHVKLLTPAAPLLPSLLKPATLCKPSQWRR